MFCICVEYNVRCCGSWRFVPLICALLVRSNDVPLNRIVLGFLDDVCSCRTAAVVEDQWQMHILHAVGLVSFVVSVGLDMMAFGYLLVDDCYSGRSCGSLMSQF